METLLTVDEAQQTVENMMVRSKDVDVKDIRFHFLGETEDEGLNGILEVGELKASVYRTQARKGMYSKLGIDFSGLKEYMTDPKLTEAMINHSIQKRAGNKVKLIHSGTDLWEIFGMDSPWIDPRRIFQLTLESLRDKSQVLGLAQADWTPDLQVALKFVTDRNSMPVARVGDYSHTGVWIRANGKVETSAYLYRLACTNGMLRDYSKVKRVAASESEDAVRANIEQSFEDANGLLKDFLALDEHPAENPSAFIAHTSRNNSYSDTVLAEVVSRTPSLGERPTRYDVVNLITATGREMEDDKFEWLGGDAVNEYKHKICSHCAHPLN